jgi:hypothetical protein
MHTDHAEVSPPDPSQTPCAHVALPEFEPIPNYPHGVLPDGVYDCDESTLVSFFVDQFTDSATRRPISEGFLKLRGRLVALGVSTTQWVDGSFVEGKMNPGDVDVVSFCDYDFANRHLSSSRECGQLLSGGEDTKPEYRSHTFVVLSCAPDHAYFNTFQQARKYWRKWFGSTRPVPDHSGGGFREHAKGFIQMPLGPNAPTISTERGA